MIKPDILWLYFRIGDTSLQERINAENVAKVFTYLDNYEQKLGSLGTSLYFKSLNMIILITDKFNFPFIYFR